MKIYNLEILKPVWQEFEAISDYRIVHGSRDCSKLFNKLSKRIHCLIIK